MVPLTASACDVGKLMSSYTIVTFPALSLARSDTIDWGSGATMVWNALQGPPELPCVAEVEAPQLFRDSRMACPAESSATRASCDSASGPSSAPESTQAPVPASCRDSCRTKLL